MNELDSGSAVVGGPWDLLRNGPNAAAFGRARERTRLIAQAMAGSGRRQDLPTIERRMAALALLEGGDGAQRRKGPARA